MNFQDTRYFISDVIGSLVIEVDNHIESFGQARNLVS